MFDKLLHKYLKLPYKLSVKTISTKDNNNSKTIVFLHGIASSSETWNNVLIHLKDQNLNLITVDLLGFGNSAKPNWSDYSLKDHSKNVIYTIKNLNLKNKPIIVGHSMGCLIAVELAANRPDFAKSLFLFNMPIYTKSDINNSIIDNIHSTKRLSNFYFSLYQALIDKKELTLKGAQKLENRAKNDTGFTLNESTWIPFKNSLNNAIKNQDSINKVLKINIPMIITYGRFDLLVINKYLKLLAKSKNNITLIPTNAGHEITPSYGKKIAEILLKKI